MNKERIKKFFTLKSVGSKILLTCFVDCAILVTLILIIFSKTLFNLETTLIESRLEADIEYLEDIIGNCEEAEWYVKDGALYRGDVFIGDGTEEKANLDPFLTVENKTGTFCYTFMKCSDEGLHWTGDNKTGYMQGHYIRVAGSTRGPSGESIIGTYIDKKVADELDEKGVYSGEANVEGGMIYCYYKVLKNKNGEIVGNIVVGRSMTELQTQAAAAGRRIFILIAAIVILAGVGIVMITSRWTKAVSKVEKYLARIGNGELPEDPLELHTKDEIGDVAASINDMVSSLKEKERIGAELSLATDIQAHMLPSIFPPFPDHYEFDIYAMMNPAKEVGGDFYDFFMIDDSHVAVVIADVSGKGVPAALFMVTTKTLIKDHAQLGLEPAEVFTRVNKILCDGNDAGLFVTGWMGVLDLNSGKLTYVNAGHNPPLLCTGNGGFRYLKSRPGFVLAGMDSVRYKQAVLQMEPGDKLYLYTDGVTEATSAEMELYGEKRLNEYLNAHQDDAVSDILHGIRADIDAFVGEAEQFDDITMLILDFKKKAGENMIEKTFQATDEALVDANAFVEGELKKAEVPAKIIMQITVALEEIFVNIAHYGYPGRTGDAKISMGIENNRVTLCIKDSGIPFNPLSKEDPDITFSADERDIGGLGIYMVKKYMDDIRYEYKDGMNVLTMEKRLG